MKVNLRKAHAIQNQIRAEMDHLEIIVDVVLNEFQDVTTQMDDAHGRSKVNRDNWDKLCEVMHKIRRSVGLANVSSGLSDLLTDAAMLDRKIKLYSRLVSAPKKEDEEVLQGRLRKLKDSEKSTFSRFSMDDRVVSGIFTDDEVEDFRKQLAAYKRSKRDIQDQILAKNVEVTITLDSDTEEVLKTFGIL